MFSYNNIDYENVNNEPVYFNDGIYTYNVDFTSKEAQLVIYNNQKFIVYNKNLYDYEKYNSHSVLIKIGVLEESESGLIFNITRDYSANKAYFIESSIKTSINISDFNNLQYKINNLDIITNSYTLVEFDTLFTGGYSNSESSSEYDSESSSDDDSIISDIDAVDDILNIEEKNIQ